MEHRRGSATAPGPGRRRIDLGTASIEALRDGRTPADPRIGPSATYGREWLPGVYEWQRRQLAERRQHGGAPD